MIVNDETLIELISNSSSITEEEKQRFIRQLPTTSETEKEKMLQAFMMERILLETMPDIRQGLIDTMEHTFDKTHEAFKKYERGLIHKHESAEEEAESKEAEYLVSSL